MEEDSEELTAYHEAGHAVMGLLSGGHVLHATISPDRDDGPERFGDASVRWHNARYRPRELALAKVRTALAGPVAEMIYTGDPYHPGLIEQWSEDWHSAWAAAENLERSELKRLRLLEQETTKLLELFQDDRIWSAIADLADNLMAHEWLDAEQILDIASQWLTQES